MARRGRKAGKSLGPLRRVLGTEPNHVWLPFSRRWVREGEAHVLECGHRLLVDPERARARGDRASAQTPGSPQRSRTAPTPRLHHTTARVAGAHTPKALRTRLSSPDEGARNPPRPTARSLHPARDRTPPTTSQPSALRVRSTNYQSDNQSHHMRTTAPVSPQTGELSGEFLAQGCSYQ